MGNGSIPWIAIKLLLGDRTKFITLVCGLAFATTLIVQQASVFCGVMLLFNVAQINSPAKIWVADTNLKETNSPRFMSAIELQRVRSTAGVEWAMPLSYSSQQVTLPNGDYQEVFLVGADSHTLTGLPTHLVAGNLSDLKYADAVMLDTLAVEKLSPHPNSPIRIGDHVEINGHQARIVAICTNARSIQDPFVYTTIDNVKTFLNKDNYLSFILVEPQKGLSIQQVVKNLNHLKNTQAYSSDALFWKTTWWNIYNTAVPITFGITIALGFIVGILISGQTFYMFIIENMRHLAVLKTIGIKDSQLFYILLLQAYWVGIISFGIGVGIASLFGYYAYLTDYFPYYMPLQLLFYALLSILAICTLAVFVGVRTIKKIDPAIVFRS